MPDGTTTTTLPTVETLRLLDHQIGKIYGAIAVLEICSARLAQCEMGDSDSCRMMSAIDLVVDSLKPIPGDIDGETSIRKAIERLGPEWRRSDEELAS